MKPDPFWYTPGPTLWVGGEARVVMLGSEQVDKLAMASSLVEQLQAPDAMPPGEMTWDDVAALLSELDWPEVEGAHAVVIFHVAVPDMPEDTLAVYLDVLRRAIAARGKREPRLVAAFPLEAHAVVSELARPG